MPQRHSFIATLGGLIYFERLDPASNEKVSTFGQTLAQLATALGGSVSLNAAADRVVLNGSSVPIGAPGASEVSDSFRDHRIQVIRFPTDPSALDFQRFAGVLGRDAGTYRNVGEVRIALGQRFTAEGEVEAPRSRPTLIRQALDLDPLVTTVTESEPTREKRAARLIEPVTTFGGVVRDVTHRDYELRSSTSRSPWRRKRPKPTPRLPAPRFGRCFGRSSRRRG